MFNRAGWMSPSLAEADLQGDAISIGNGVLRDVLITGNVIRGMRSALAINNGIRFDNITFRGNEVIGFQIVAVQQNDLRWFVAK